MKKFCYTILEGQYDENGYIPSAVFENERGHNPMKGNGDCSAPWRWGKTLKEAQETCLAFNRDQLGIDEKDAILIVLSSMFPHS